MIDDIYGVVSVGDRALPSPQQIMELRKQGCKNAGRLYYNYISNVSNKEKIITNLRNDYISNPEYIKNEWTESLAAYGDEFTFYSLLANELSDLYTVFPFGKYVSMIKAGPYYEVFAQFNDEFFIKTISRLDDRQVFRIYIDRKKPESNEIFKNFLIRNFPERKDLIKRCIYYISIT